MTDANRQCDVERLNPIEANMSKPQKEKPRIVIVGGGAGGLELATRLGDKYGRKGTIEVTLIERNRTHIWKPEIARDCCWQHGCLSARGRLSLAGVLARLPLSDR